MKKQCTRNKANRTITREENEGLMEAMAARMKGAALEVQAEEDARRTSVWTIKRWFGYTHFLLRAWRKYGCEWA